ncbi:hypothetical protein BH20ACT2_BH20ACT2_07720 [soil metagenome]
MHRIDSLLGAARRGAGQLVVVTGEAGIGKTRFCAAVGDRAALAGFAMVVGRGWLDRGAPAMWPWQPVLSQLCGEEAAALLDGDPGRSTVDPERFARFVAVADRLGQACADTPVVVVIDDLHATDPSAVLLTRFVARELHRLRLVLVVTRRAGEPQGNVEVGRLLDDLEREGTLLSLAHLDLRETTALLESDGGGPVDPDLALASLRVTGGNPLFLRNLLTLGSAGGDYQLSGGLRRASEAVLDRLAVEDRGVLAGGALLGAEPTVAETAALTGVAPTTVLATVAAAAAAGLVTVDGPNRYAFVHDLVREVLEAGLTPVRRLDLHARAATLIGDSVDAPDALARRAHHALAAATRSPVDAQIAVDACRAAARSMVRRFSYERAADLLAAAIELHDRGPLDAPPGVLLVERALAVLQSGRLAEARTGFDRAATAAVGENDPVLLAQAALGLGGVWLHEHRDEIEHQRVHDLQQRALATLPPTQPLLARRLEMRLAAEAAYDGGPVDAALMALDAVRALGDGPALAEALSLCHHAMLTIPAHHSDRLALADELVSVASASGEGMLSLFGLCWRAVDLFQLGDPNAGRALAELRMRADAVDCRSIGYVVGVIDVMSLIRAGQLDAAEEAALQCHQTGIEVGDADALGYLGAHLFTIRWLQGRADEIVDPLEEMASSPTVTSAAAFSFRAALADVAAEAGRLDRARAVLAALCAGGLERAPLTSTWLTGMRLVVEAARVLGDDAVAKDAYRLLLPYAALPVMSSLAVVDHGSVEGALGSAALAFGEPDLAVAHLERALTANRLLGNRPFAAIARADLACALRCRSDPGDAGRAEAAFAEAVAEAEAMGMTLRAAAVWACDARDAGLLVREGRHWTVSLGEHRAVVADIVGMDHLALLLTRPGVDVPALTLAGGGDGLADGSTRQPLLDDTARAAYSRRVRELTADLDEAEANADLARAERLRLELDALCDELRRAAGFGGRPGAFAAPSERARTAVRKAIKRAIDEIAATDDEIGTLLRNTVRTGSTCSYQPGGDRRVTWRTTTAPEPAPSVPEGGQPSLSKA